MVAVRVAARATRPRRGLLGRSASDQPAWRCEKSSRAVVGLTQACLSTTVQISESSHVAASWSCDPTLWSRKRVICSGARPSKTDIRIAHQCGRLGVSSVRWSLSLFTKKLDRDRMCAGQKKFGIGKKLIKIMGVRGLRIRRKLRERRQAKRVSYRRPALGRTGHHDSSRTKKM